MSPVMVGGQRWEDHRPWENGPTHLELNDRALAPASHECGYCLCLHPFSDIIDMRGLSCKWCDQPVTDASTSLEARTLRTQAILAAFPQLAR